jgi:hypothetical protein
MIKKLGNKKFNIFQFAIIAGLIFNHKVGLNSSVIMLIAMKLAVLYFGVGAGMKLQEVLRETNTKNEKMLHLSLVMAVIAIMILILNFKYF